MKPIPVESPIQSSPIEREPYGITYDRFRLDKLFGQLLNDYPIRTVLEYPAEGSKAMPSIYSLALATRGCKVTLVNPEEQGLAVWERLNLLDRVETIYIDDISTSDLESNQWDLVWNFVTLGFRPDFRPILKEMSRLTRQHVLTVHCNAYNWGYPWHHFLHWLFDLPWTHGQTDFFWPHKVKHAYKNAGLSQLNTGLLDMPWWPDPPGFRDIRLHKAGLDDVTNCQWYAPIEDYYRTQKMHPALKLLSKIEDSPIPKLPRWVFSHLFYVHGQTERQL